MFQSYISVPPEKVRGHRNVTLGEYELTWVKTRARMPVTPIQITKMTEKKPDPYSDYSIGISVFLS